MSIGDLERNLIQRVTVGDLLTRSAARHPERLAVIDGERRFTYRAFDAWVNQTANGLAARGYGRGDALALMSSNSAEFLATYFACAKLGLICVPINLLWRQGELGYVLDHAAARGIVVESALLDQLRPALEHAPGLTDIFVVGAPAIMGERRLTDFAALAAESAATAPACVIEDRAPISYLYTSGTTSAPKGVVGNHLAIYLESLGAALDMRMGKTDRVAALLPMFHTAQLNAVCTPAIAVGAAIYALRGFEAPRLLDLIAREQISMIFCLPMMYRALMEEQAARPRDVSSLRLALYGMAPLAKHELERAIATFDCDFSLLFGQTEMSPVSSVFQPEHQLSHAGAAGTPSINVQVAIMDAAGNVLPQGQSGEIVYRSPQTLTGYLRNEAATDEAFRHGWFHSGDAGYFDSDSILWFEDRFKDVIKSGGENVASLEVETAIYATERCVAETAVVGLPHPRWGEAITAVVVLKPGETLDQEATIGRIRAGLSAFKCPKAIIAVESLPKTATGKVQKMELRKRFAEYYAEND